MPLTRKLLRFPLLSLCLTVLLFLTGWNGADGQRAPFGPAVLVFDPSMKREVMQSAIDAIYERQKHNEFSRERYAILLQPGEYHLDIPIGFYTQVLGLGATPDAVHVTGNVHVDAALGNDNATTTFWRSAENFSVTPTGGTMQWAVSQAISFRRMHVLGSMKLNQRHGWASGGWMSDTLVDGQVDSGTQQQWISRNTEWNHWIGSNWNMVFVGDTNPPAGQWPQPPFTKVDVTPVLREKPYLTTDSHGGFQVQVPALRQNTSGISWHPGAVSGKAVPLSRFYIAHAATDTAATLNAALRRGQNLLFTPGIYPLTQPLRVTRAGTVVMGLGLATLQPTQGTEALTIADVDGVSVAGLLFDAGPVRSPALLRVGEPGSHRRHARNPIALYDVFFRVGGAAEGKVDANLVIDASDTVVDHTWIWRADHGQGVGWTANESRNGLVVNGDNVTIYGLFVEHHQQYQVLWTGEGGRTYFYQSEIPYDPPSQQAWTGPAGEAGWASYKVSDQVKVHEAWGFGVYSVFRQPNVNLERAIEVPHTPQVRFHHMITVALDDKGAILHVIDDTGESTQTKPRLTPKVTDFPEN